MWVTKRIKGVIFSILFIKVEKACYFFEREKCFRLFLRERGPGERTFFKYRSRQKRECTYLTRWGLEMAEREREREREVDKNSLEESSKKAEKILTFYCVAPLRNLSFTGVCLLV